MPTRALGALLATLAAVAFVVSIVSGAWWDGHPRVDGRVYTAKSVHIGLLGGQGCNTGGTGECQPLELGATFTTVGYGELGGLGLATAFAILVAGAAWRISDSRKRLAKVGMVVVLLAAAGAGALIVLGPQIKTAQKVDPPIGWGLMVLGGGVVAMMGAGLVTQRVEREPLRLKSPPKPAPEPATFDVREILREQHEGLRPSGPIPTGSQLPGPSGPLGAPLFDAAPQLRPLYDVQGAAPTPAAPQLPTRAPTPMPRASAHAIAGLDTPQPFDVPPSPFGEPSQPFGAQPSSQPQPFGAQPSPFGAQPPPFGSPDARTKPPTAPPPRTGSPTGAPPLRTGSPTGAPLPRTGSPTGAPLPRTGSPTGAPLPRTGSPTGAPPLPGVSPSPPGARGKPPSVAPPMRPGSPSRPPPFATPAAMPPGAPTAAPFSSKPGKYSPPSVEPLADPLAATQPAPARIVPPPRPPKISVPPPRSSPLARNSSPPTPTPSIVTSAPKPDPGAPAAKRSSPTLAHSVPPMPVIDTPPPQLVRASTENDDRLETAMRETESITAVEIDHEAKARFEEQRRQTAGRAETATGVAEPASPSRQPSVQGEDTDATDLGGDRPGSETADSVIGPPPAAPAAHAQSPVQPPQRASQPAVQPAQSEAQPFKSLSALASRASQPHIALPGLAPSAPASAAPAAPAASTAPATPAAPNVPISTAPASLPPPKTATLPVSGPTPACPQCESPMAWVEEHLRFYCKSCRMYF